MATATPASLSLRGAAALAAGADVAAAVATDVAATVLPLPLTVTRRATVAARALLNGGPAVRRASENVAERVFRGRLADVRPTPHTVLLDEPLCTVRRYLPATPTSALPVVLVPPLGASARVYDLRRGASLVGTLMAAGRRVYVLDYGRISLADRRLSLADFVDAGVGRAVEVASRDSGGRPVVLAGWCAGGIFAALHTATARRGGRVAGLALIASPLDMERGHPYHGLARLPVTQAALRLARETGLPAPLVSFVFRMTQPGKQLSKPLTLLRNLDDREFLAHIEALDEYIAGFAAYPGVAGYELVQALVDGDLGAGRATVAGRRADWSRVRVPALVVAGTTDVLAPAPVVEAWRDVLPDAEYHLVRGGHLGVMAGRRAPETTWAMLERFAERVEAGLPRPARTRRPGRQRPRVLDGGLATSAA